MPELKQSWRFLLVFMCLMLLNAVPSVGLAQPVTVVRLRPSAITLAPGASTIIEVWVEDVVDLVAYDLEIHFDPGKLIVSNVQNGDFLVGLLPAPSNIIDNDNGVLKFGLTQGAVEPVSDTGILFTFQITAKDNPGNSILENVETELVNKSIFLIDCEVFDATVNITGEILDYFVFLPIIMH